MIHVPTTIPQQIPHPPVRRILTSHSIDNTFESCARKFEFLNIYDKRPPRDSGYAADVGTALHEGTQAFLIARAEGKEDEAARAAGFWAMLLHFPWDQESEQHTKVRSFTNVVGMLVAIFDADIWDEWELVRVKDRGWAIEVPFLIDHTSLGLFQLGATGEWCILSTQGKIDFILRNKRTGEIRCWDLKTTSKPRDLIRSEFTWAGQQVGYTEVIRAITENPDPKFEVYYLIACFSAGDPPYIEAIPMIKTQDDVDDYWLDKLDRLKRMRQYAIDGRFPRRNGGCNAYQNECSCFRICPSRDHDLIQEWFDDVLAIPQAGYEPWITMEL